MINKNNTTEDKNNTSIEDIKDKNTSIEDIIDNNKSIEDNIDKNTSIEDIDNTEDKNTIKKRTEDYLNSFNKNYKKSEKIIKRTFSFLESKSVFENNNVSNIKKQLEDKITPSN